MKKVIIFLFIISYKCTSAQTMNPHHLRLMYYNASQNSSDADQLYKLLKNADSTQPLLLGYKAMSEFMKCYHSFNPISKLSYFYKGKSDLDQAISLVPQSIELRYLRFTVQTNAPLFLNYHNYISDDKILLMRELPINSTDAELISMIKKYMINSSSCSQQEKEFFKTLRQ